jgi:hypothetical protein
MSKSLATKNVASILVAAALVFGFAFSFAAPAKADTASDLQAQVQALLAQIAALQGSTTMTGGCHTFTQNLKLGSSGGEVMWVQQFLNGHGFTVAASGAGSPGNESSYFGAKTKAAVIKFQNANAATILVPVGLTSGTGNWFASTRAAVNAMCAANPNPTPGPTPGPVVPGALNIRAGSQPANSLAPEGASRVPFTTFTLTNSSNVAVTVNGVTVQRTGLGSNSVFSGIVLVDSNNVQIGNSKTLNSNDQATVGDTFTIQPGQSMTLTVAGNMAASLDAFSGQIVSLSVVGVNTTATVSGSLPITGASQTINGTLAIGSVSTSTSSFDPGSNQNKSIGDSAVRFAGVRFTANSSEDLQRFSIRWRQTGTASSADISNVVTVVNGTSYPTTVDASGKYYVSVFPGGILIAKGNSADVYVQGDITGSNASSRTVEFDLDKTSDVYFVGQTFGYGVAPTSTDGHLTHGYVTTIQGGSATAIQNASSVVSANIPLNVNNTILGGFQTNFVGEPVSVSGITLTISTTSGSLVDLVTGISIVNENGAVVAGPQDATWTTGHVTQTVTLSDTVTFPLGLHTYTVKGKIPSTTANGTAIRLSTTPSTGWTSPTGQTSGNTVTLPSGSVTMSTQTVKGASLNVQAAPTPVTQTIVAGGTGVTLGTIQLDATQSGEDIRVNSIPLDIVISNADDYTELNTCQLYNGSTALNTGSNVPTLTASNTDITPATANSLTVSLDNSLIVAKGTSVSLTFRCNVVSGASGGVQVGVFNSTGWSVTGVQSGTSVPSGSLTVGSSFSGIQTYGGSGTFTAAVDTGTPVSRAYAAAGTTQVTATNIKIHATSEPVTLTKLGLTLTGSVCGTKSTGAGGTSNGCVNDVVQAVIYDGATPIGSATFTGTTNTATSSLTTTVTVPANTDKILTVKVDLAQIGVSAAGGIGDLVKVSPLNAEAIGQSSGSTIQVGATGTSNGLQLVRTSPVVANGNAASFSNNNGCNGSNQTLKRFSVTANSANPVGVYQVNLTVATSSAVQVTALNLYAYTDASYSSPLSSQGSGSGLVDTKTPDSSTYTASYTASTLIEIQGGQTVYFALLGTVVPSGVTYSVNATLNGDVAQTGLGTGNTNGYIATTTAAAVTSGDKFIWSDNATTTAATTDVDWFNGFQVQGLPSTGI